MLTTSHTTSRTTPSPSRKDSRWVATPPHQACPRPTSPGLIAVDTLRHRGLRQPSLVRRAATIRAIPPHHPDRRHSSLDTRRRLVVLDSLDRLLSAHLRGVHLNSRAALRPRLVGTHPITINMVAAVGDVICKRRRRRGRWFSRRLMKAITLLS